MAKLTFELYKFVLPSYYQISNLNLCPRRRV